MSVRERFGLVMGEFGGKGGCGEEQQHFFGCGIKGMNEALQCLLFSSFFFFLFFFKRSVLPCKVTSSL